MKQFENNIRPHKTYHKNDFFCPRCWIFEPMIHFGFSHAAMGIHKFSIGVGGFLHLLRTETLVILGGWASAKPRKRSVQKFNLKPRSNTVIPSSSQVR